MDKPFILENEKIHKKFMPHPLSFLELQAVPIFLLSWGLITLWITEKTLPGDAVPSVSLWWLGLLAGGIITSLLTIRWRIFFIYLGILIIGIGIIYGNGWLDQYKIFIPAYSALVSLIGFIFVDLYRRSHVYYITNYRLVLRGGILKSRERLLRYDKITDIEGSQGVLGSLFHFGNIIPITQSGLGLGSDASLAAGGIDLNPTKKVGGGMIVGGKKELQTPRTRSYYELHGTHPYREIRAILEQLVQKSTIAPYQKEQVELQKEMVDLLRQHQK